ncbi:MAG: RNA pseudouridine synthase [Saprospiraceae bacterium]|nr:RNA pseudouridine synthase [Saprospiraceae bacterium]
MLILDQKSATEKFKVLDEQQDFIIVTKQHGIAVQATDTAQEDIESLLKRQYGNEIYVLNRIDQPVSGLVIFGKNKRFADQFTEMLKARIVRKTYLALVSGNPEKERTMLRHFIKKLHNRAMTADEPLTPEYKEAILYYTAVQEFDNYHLLKIELKTGRFHQIRAQLATVDLRIKGDLKYGSKRPNINRSIGLLSYKLEFEHPDTGITYAYIAPLPDNDILWNLVDVSKID